MYHISEGNQHRSERIHILVPACHVRLLKNEASRSPPQADGILKRNCAVALTRLRSVKLPPSLWLRRDKSACQALPSLLGRSLWRSPIRSDKQQGFQAKANKGLIAEAFLYQKNPRLCWHHNRINRKFMIVQRVNFKIYPRMHEIYPETTPLQWSFQFQRPTPMFTGVKWINRKEKNSLRSQRLCGKSKIMNANRLQKGSKNAA